MSPSRPTYSPRQYFRGDEELAVVRIGRQEPVPLHAHQFHELVIVLGGEGDHVLKGDSYRIRAGDVFVLPPGLFHRYGNMRDLELVNILYRREHMQMPLADMTDLPGYYALFELEPGLRLQQNLPCRLHLNDRALRRVAPLVAAMETELTIKNPGYRCMALSHFYRLCGDLSRAYTQVDSAESSSLLQLSALLSRLETGYASTFTVEKMAGFARMSRSTLHRHFRKCFGLAPLDYLLRLRLAKAADRLIQTDAPISRIAFQVGFHDSNYFSRQFRKVYGLSPRTFRKNGVVSP